MPEPDTGFAPSEEEEKEPICGGPPPPDPGDPKAFFTADTEPTPKAPISRMCSGGYHGMCQGNRQTCRCPCHQATRRIPVEPVI
jgi:hypothetical protein